MEEDRGEMRKSGSILRGIGMFLMIMGMFFVIMVMFPFLYGITLDQSFSFIGFIMAIVGFGLLFISMFLRIVKRYESFSFLKCSLEKCEYNEVRDFHKGDYVFKELERTCKKCGSNMYINQIAELPLKMYKTEEYPIKDKKPDKDKEKFITKTLIKCDDPSCDYEETRDFQENDVVFKKIENKKCSKCNSLLYIHEIHDISEEKLKTLIEEKS
ncbi:MAG: hypothetical protein EAX96_12090 [Candidatus Lokiarchaeota archaeon]|nr:hypothetical protein [Candidatus Lokiarchaeota archaeon]